MRSASSLRAAGRDARVRSCLQGGVSCQMPAMLRRQRQPTRCAPWQRLPAGRRGSRAQGAHSIPWARAGGRQVLQLLTIAAKRLPQAEEHHMRSQGLAARASAQHAARAGCGRTRGCRRRAPPPPRAPPAARVCGCGAGACPGWTGRTPAAGRPRRRSAAAPRRPRRAAGAAAGPPQTRQLRTRGSFKCTLNFT
jgi:hypothetical protein